MRFTIGLPTDRVDARRRVRYRRRRDGGRPRPRTAGFDACFVTDHPPRRDGSCGGGHHALDPFVALSFAAAATTRIGCRPTSWCSRTAIRS